jgi:hypothetical protein
VALTFGCIALARPDVFSYFSKEPVLAESIAADAIRWSAPFVFGFAGFAWASLSFPGEARRAMAKVFTASFTIATLVGAWIEGSGRWNELHFVYVLFFASMALGYAAFAFGAPHAFHEEGQQKRSA